MRVRTEAKRTAILAAAARVFREAGFERATMDQICARAGGSKATLYSYFPSKKALFVEATLARRREQIEPLLDLLQADTPSLRSSLRRFGERFLALTCRPDFVAVRRAVIAEAGRSEIGRMFYEVGPKPGEKHIGAFLRAQMVGGRLRKADPRVATCHLMALLESETLHRNLLAVRPARSRHEIKRVAERSVDAFLRAYSP